MSAWEIFTRSFIEKEGYLTVLDGLKNTFLIALFGLLIGIILGTLVAAIKVTPVKNPLTKVLSAICEGYIALFRGTPIVVQLLLVYFVLFPAIGLRVSAINVAIITFGVNSGAYVSEIMRGGINSVDFGQMEAARSLGFGYTRSMWNVVLPQAVKNIVPTLGNELIVLIKETSVVSFIAVVDVTKAFRSIADSNYEYIVPYCMLALVYLVIVVGFTFGIRALERRLKRSDRSR